MFEKLTDNIWRYHDQTGSTSYLVVGETRAAMIDCGAIACPLMDDIRAITPLPVDLLLTHAHPDHYGAAAEFDSVYLHEGDIAALPVFEEAFALMGVAPLSRDTLHPLADGQVFDLGGLRLTACELIGHTPGSTVFICKEARCIFSGDAVGSGDIVLMSVPLASNLRDFRASLLAFLERSAPYADYTWLAGHFHQAQRENGESNPPCRALCEDMAALCQALTEGSLEGFAVNEIFAPEGKAFRSYMGRAGIVYAANQL